LQNIANTDAHDSLFTSNTFATGLYICRMGF